jgi:hypothetical protein
VSLVKLIMRRAKNAPLIFYASDMVTLPCLEGIKEALSEPHRLLSLSLEVRHTCGPLSQCLARCLGRLPLLEKLHVSK